jgi:hypothetical protein
VGGKVVWVRGGGVVWVVCTPAQLCLAGSAFARMELALMPRVTVWRCGCAGSVAPRRSRSGWVVRRWHPSRRGQQARASRPLPLPLKQCDACVPQMVTSWTAGVVRLSVCLCNTMAHG